MLCAVGSWILKFNINKWNIIYWAIPVHEQMEKYWISWDYWKCTLILCNILLTLSVFHSFFPLEGGRRENWSRSWFLIWGINTMKKNQRHINKLNITPTALWLPGAHSSFHWTPKRAFNKVKLWVWHFSCSLPGNSKLSPSCFP